MIETKHHCIICRRKLTNPKSIQQKMGEVCHKKFNAGYKGIQMEIVR